MDGDYDLMVRYPTRTRLDARTHIERINWDCETSAGMVVGAHGVWRGRQISGDVIVAQPMIDPDTTLIPERAVTDTGDRVASIEAGEIHMSEDMTKTDAGSDHMNEDMTHTDASAAHMSDSLTHVDAGASDLDGAPAKGNT